MSTQTESPRSPNTPKIANTSQKRPRVHEPIVMLSKAQIAHEILMDPTFRIQEHDISWQSKYVKTAYNNRKRNFYNILIDQVCNEEHPNYTVLLEKIEDIAVEVANILSTVEQYATLVSVLKTRCTANELAHTLPNNEPMSNQFWSLVSDIVQKAYRALQALHGDRLAEYNVANDWHAVSADLEAGMQDEKGRPIYIVHALKFLSNYLEKYRMLKANDGILGTRAIVHQHGPEYVGRVFLERVALKDTSTVQTAKWLVHAINKDVSLLPSLRNGTPMAYESMAKNGLVHLITNPAALKRGDGSDLPEILELDERRIMLARDAFHDAVVVATAWGVLETKPHLLDYRTDLDTAVRNHRSLDLMAASPFKSLPPEIADHLKKIVDIATNTKNPVYKLIHKRVEAAWSEMIHAPQAAMTKDKIKFPDTFGHQQRRRTMAYFEHARVMNKVIHLNLKTHPKVYNGLTSRILARFYPTDEPAIVQDDDNEEVQ